MRRSLLVVGLFALAVLLLGPAIAVAQVVVGGPNHFVSHAAPQPASQHPASNQDASWWFYYQFWFSGSSGGGFGGVSTPVLGPPMVMPGPAAYPANNDYTQSRYPASNDVSDRSKVKAAASASLRRVGPTNAEAAALIALGDENFSKQKFTAALERYRNAARVFPKSADAHFRQAFARIALGQLAEAAQAFRRGLRIRSDWSDSGFQLDLIYPADRLTATNENLAKKLEARPRDTNLLMALGMQLYFNGQHDRGAALLGRAVSLGADPDQLLGQFLEPAAQAEVPRKAAGGKTVF